MAKVIGLLLAAGAGTRMGQPKALVIGGDDVPWVAAAARMLINGGCDATVVVLGASAAQARPFLDGEPVTIVEASDWADGMSASLRAGLRVLATDASADAALIHLVDLPDVGPNVVARMLAHAAPDALARAIYRNGPGHPVVIGREHWSAIIEDLGGDAGAGHYLAQHHAEEIDCSDLASGHDVDDVRSMLGK